MAHPVQKLANTNFDEQSQADAFKQVLEDHLPEFKTREVRVVEISGEQRTRCTGDFYALLTENDIELDKFWLVLRINDYTSPEEFIGDRSSFVVPDPTLYSELLEKYKSRERAL